MSWSWRIVLVLGLLVAASQGALAGVDRDVAYYSAFYHGYGSSRGLQIAWAVAHGMDPGRPDTSVSQPITTGSRGLLLSTRTARQLAQLSTKDHAAGRLDIVGEYLEDVRYVEAEGSIGHLRLLPDPTLARITHLTLRLSAAPSTEDLGLIVDRMPDLVGLGLKFTVSLSSTGGWDASEWATLYTALSKLEGLKEVSLRYVPNGHSAMAAAFLAGLGKLTALELAHCPGELVSEDLLDTNAERLDWLKLSRLQDVNADLLWKFLPRMSALRFLSLIHFPISSVGGVAEAEALSGLRQLRALHIWGHESFRGKESLRAFNVALAGLRELRHLTYQPHYDPSWCSLPPVKSFTRLKSLATGIMNPQVAEWIRSLHQLSDMHWTSEYERATTEALAVLRELPRLERLHLRLNPAEDMTLEALHGLRVQQFELSMMRGLTEDKLASLIRSLSHIQVLRLPWDHGVPDPGAGPLPTAEDWARDLDATRRRVHPWRTGENQFSRPVLDALKSLETLVVLDLRDSNVLMFEDLPGLLEALPNLALLRIRTCRETSWMSEDMQPADIKTNLRFLDLSDGLNERDSVAIRKALPTTVIR
jgi:hypothetical protein